MIQLNELRLSPKYLPFIYILVIILAAHLRLGAVNHSEVDTPIRADARDYFLYAYNLNNHGIYSRQNTINPNLPPTPDALRAPGYPILLSLIIGETPTAQDLYHVYLIQALLSVFVVLLIMDIGRRVFGHAIGIIAGTLTSISPHLINANIYLLSESLFTFQIVLFFWLIALATQIKSTKLSIVFFLSSALVISASALTRPVNSYFYLALIPFTIFFYREHYNFTKIRILAIWVLLTISLNLIWTVRNYVSIGQSGDPRLTINALHHGMYPNMMYEDRPETYGFPYRFDSATFESPTDVIREISNRTMQSPTKYIA